MAAAPRHTILIVDTETDFIDWAAKHLAAADTVVQGVADAESALAAYKKHKPSLVIAEFLVPPFNGLELLKRLRLTDPNAMVVLTTGAPPTNAVIESMKLGGYDFLRKAALPYELRQVVEAALQTHEEMNEDRSKGPKSIEIDRSNEVIIGQSPAMQEVFKLIGRVSRVDAPVLITGESGCGKEVVAHAVHRFSPRSRKPFVAINCAAIPESLLESELFGHEKGAFTGAMQQRVGRFEQANGGTLFLDEIGEMPVLIQSKLLRVLQEGEFSRVGGNQTLSSNVRIIAATNRNPEIAIEKGTFREDLFYRLNVVRIHLPPLRERTEDIKPLAEFFLNRISKERRGHSLRFSEGALRLFESYNWPGNVRELENIIQRAGVLSTGNIIMPKDLPVGAELMAGDSSQLESGAPDWLGILKHLLARVDDEGLTPMDLMEKNLLRAAMEHAANDPAEAAGTLGIGKAALLKRLKKLGLAGGAGSTGSTGDTGKSSGADH